MAKAQAQEPSMEEILASIRRIIADEEAAPPAPAATAAAEGETISEEDLDKLFASADEPEEDDDDDDVLPLTEELEEPVAAVVEPPLVEGLEDAGDIAFAEEMADEPEPELEPEPEPMPPPPPPPLRAEPPRAAVAPTRAYEPPPMPAFSMPEATAEAVPLLSDATEGFVSSAFNDLAMTVLNRNARTLEDLVQDMLRPMLKAWLDQNLPGMVERMVRAEIERVTRGR